MTEAIIAAGVIVAWCAVMIAVSDRRLWRPHWRRDVLRHQRVYVDAYGVETLRVNEELLQPVDREALYAAMRRAGVKLQAFSEAMHLVGDASERAAVSARQFTEAWRRFGRVHP